MTSPFNSQLPPMPDVLEGFQSIRRYWDKTHNCYAAKILPGEYYVTREDELVTTVLGSCVSACIRDTVAGIGGMNHFMLPMHKGDKSLSILSDAARYGNYAMEHLINDILRQGGKRNRLEFKLFGGGRIMKGMMDIGNKNIEFVEDYIRVEGFSVASQDLGDIYPRKVVYFPRTGRVLMKKLRSMHNDTIIQRENRYIEELRHEPVQGEVELF